MGENMKKAVCTLFMFCMIFSTVKVSYAQFIDATAETQKQVQTKGPADITATATATARISSAYGGYEVTSKDRISYGADQIAKCKRERNCDGFEDEYVKKSCNACCEVTGAVAKWENEICKCPQPFYEFNVDIKKCEPITDNELQAMLDINLNVDVKENQSEEKSNCSAELLAKLEELKEQFSSNSEILNSINEIIDLCDDGDVENANILYASLKILISKEYKKSTKMENISKAIATMKDIEANSMKLTVWRDEDGNFNTSRLLSDSIAGVVLGTAGGLITSNVVKKSQVENGFEDIQCTVGGQVVAGWGDEFRVGIQ